jgi:hypothetical protein
VTNTRKTIRIADVLLIANGMLANSADAMTAERSAIATLTEALLMDAGAYKGFSFLDETDETRRYYYGATS